jgi:DNA-binding transcriptional ArsR family regulator
MNYHSFSEFVFDSPMRGSLDLGIAGECPVTTNDAVASEVDLEQLTALFRLLSDKTRLNILLMLSAGERNVTSLCNQLRLPQPTVSHHLGLLRMNNIIGNRRNGKQVFYQLNGRVDMQPGGSIGIHTEHYIVSITRTGATFTRHPMMASDAVR